MRVKPSDQLGLKLGNASALHDIWTATEHARALWDKLGWMVEFVRLASANLYKHRHYQQVTAATTAMNLLKEQLKTGKQVTNSTHKEALWDLYFVYEKLLSVMTMRDFSKIVSLMELEYERHVKSSQDLAGNHRKSRTYSVVLVKDDPSVLSQPESAKV